MNCPIQLVLLLSLLIGVKTTQATLIGELCKYTTLNVWMEILDTTVIGATCAVDRKVGNTLPGAMATEILTRPTLFFLTYTTKNIITQAKQDGFTASEAINTTLNLDNLSVFAKTCAANIFLHLLSNSPSLIEELFFTIYIMQALNASWTYFSD